MAMTEKKYCVLPGQTPVRLTSLSGTICIVGEEPRRIPVEFERDAYKEGCYSEDQLGELINRLKVAFPGSVEAGKQQEEDGKASENTTPGPGLSLVTAPLTGAGIASVGGAAAAVPGIATGPGTPANLFDANQPPKGQAAASVADEDAAKLARMEKIRVATLEILNTGDEAQLMKKGGKPKVEALETKLGFQITEQERDAAFDAAKG